MKKLIGILLFGLLLVGNSGLAVFAADGPSDVYIDAATGGLMVKKPGESSYSPFVIKGVNWSPATRAPLWAKAVACLVPNEDRDEGIFEPMKTDYYGFFFDWTGRYPQGHEILRHWLRNEMFEYYVVDSPLMKEMNVNTVRLVVNLGSPLENYATYSDYIDIVLDELYAHDIMAIMTIVISKEDVDSERYLEAVYAHKRHPAVLMWAIGNEWNFNKLYNGDLDNAGAAQIVNQVAAKVKTLDKHHPVCSVLGDSPDDFNAIVSACPDVDAWGFNLYRGRSFKDFFTQWQALAPSLPVFISEFGIDSYYTQSCKVVAGTSGSNLADDVEGYQDEQRQADIDAALWDEIKEQVLNSKVLCLGGLIHEFNDSLWKVGNYHVGLGGLVDYGSEPEKHSYARYNNEGFVLGPVTASGSVDESGDDILILNEEHFGVVTADRKPKRVYEVMQGVWGEELTPGKPNQPPVFTKIAAGQYQAKVGQYVSFNVVASDPDGDSVSLSAKMLDGNSIDSIGAQFRNEAFSWIPQVVHAGKKYIVVFQAEDSRGGTASRSVTFDVAPLLIPEITYLQPGKGYAGTYIYLYGKNFGSKSSGGIVKFGSRSAEIRNWTDSFIRCKVPALSAGDYEITVSNGSSAVSNAKVFTIIPSRPKVTAIKQDTQDIRKCIISGSDFGEYNQESKVYFWSRGYGQVVSWKNDEIIIQLPPQISKESRYYCVVHTTGGWSSYVSFYYKESAANGVKVIHTPVETAVKGKNLSVRVDIQGDIRYAYVIHSYFSGYGSWVKLRWRTAWLKSEGDSYVAIIPGYMIKPSYMQYYIVGCDKNGTRFCFDQEGNKYNRDSLRTKPFYVSVQ